MSDTAEPAMPPPLGELPDLPDLAALPPMAVAGRIERLRALLAGAGCDALLVTSLVNIRYLTGFTGTAALVLAGPDELVFVTDGRYAQQADEQLRGAGVAARIEVSGTAQREIVRSAGERYPRVGLEADDVSWAQQRRYATEWFPAAELVATDGLVERLRTSKDEGEVARIEAAAIIADHALEAIRPLLEDGVTEQHVAIELDATMRRLGATDRSFETIVGSGPNGAMPHARPTTRAIGPGDLVVLDFGAVVDGYCSDVTRTLMVGDWDATQQRMYAVVRDAQAAGVAALRPGVAASAVDAACREVIAAAGWGDAFVHGTGHGVGLQIHEAPRVAASVGTTLEAGQVVTVEPGVYLPGIGGVRIEDTLVVTADGARALTHSPKRPHQPAR